MNPSTIFRFFVVASIALAGLGGTVDFLAPGLLPSALNEAYEAYLATEEPTLSSVIALSGLSLLLLIGAVVGTIGLLLFKRWARWLSLWLTALSVLLYPFLGPVLSSGWVTMLTEASMMLWGAALAMAYFSEIKVRFESDGAGNALQATSEDARA